MKNINLQDQMLELFDVSHMGQLFIKGDENLTEDLEKIFPLDLKNLN